jgi:hypothetical protein
MSVRALVVSVLIAAAVASCRGLVGVTDRVALNECDTCLELEGCAAITEACRHDAACESRSECISNCPAGAADCVVRCTGSSAYGEVDPVGDYEACRATKCAGACSVTCAQVPLLANDSASSTCPTCIASSCCDVADQCLNNPGCTRLVECVRAQGTRLGTDICRNRLYPDGQPTLMQLESCVQAHCGTECEFGNYWGCAERARPPATIDVVTHTLNIFDLEAIDQPLGGIHVSVCQPTDPECVHPVVDDYSNERGQLDFTLNLSSKFGRIRFSGFIRLDDPSGTYVRTVNAFYPGLVLDGATTNLLMAKPSTLATIGAVLGQRLDPARGQALILVQDCASRGAKDVTLAVEPSDDETKVFYLAAGTPSRAAIATDSQGAAVVVNALPGSITVTMTPRDLGRPVGKIQALIQAGALTENLVQPSPL